MKKVTIPEHLKGKELFKFLIENKSALIAQKKSLPIKFSEAVSYSPGYFRTKEDGVTVKAALSEFDDDVSSVRVKVVANTAFWCDSYMDVLTDDCWKKTIKERKGLIPHLHDHEHKIDAEIGDVDSIYTEEILLSELGINQQGKASCLVFETDVKREYNKKVFDKYRKGKIKQHSIGFRYVKLELAINDEESEKEYDFWKKYYSKVINKEVVDEKGYFWVVSEIILLENSCVIFGANEITPTLEVRSDSTDPEPPKGTQEQPPREIEAKGVDWGKISEYLMK